MRKRMAAGAPALLLALLFLGTARAQPREYLDALRAARDKQPDRALQLLRELIGTRPEFGRSYVWLATVSRDAGQVNASLEWLSALAASGSPYAYYGAALLHRQRKEFEDAERRLMEVIESVTEFLPAYSEVASLAVQRGRTAEAAALLERMSRDSPRSAGPPFGLGYMQMLKGEYAQALESLAQAAVIRPEAFEIGDAQYHTYYGSNRFAEALEVAGRMLRLAEQTGDRQWKSRLLGRIGGIHLDLGNLTAAASELAESLEIARDIMPVGEQITRANLGAVYARMGRSSEALHEYRESLRLARETGDRRNEGRNLGLIAAIYADTAEYSRAAEAFSESIAIAREIGDRPSEATQLANLSLIHDALGNHAQALPAVERALAIARGVKNPWLEGRFLEIQGLIYRHLGRDRDALAGHQRGLAIAREIGSKYREASALWRTGEAHAALGERIPARASYEQAVAIAEQIGARTTQAAALNGIGRLEMRSGDPSAALRAYGRALRIADEIRSPEIAWQARAGMASVTASSHPTEALSHYRAALDAVEQVRNRLTLTEERAGFLEDKVRVYRDMVRVLMELHAREPAAGHDREAFRIAERSHARAFLDLLAEGKSEIDPSLLEKRHTIESRIASLQSRAVAEHQKVRPDRAKLAQFDADLSAAAEEHESVLRRTRERSAADAAAGEPIMLPQVRELLEPDTVLLEYSLGEQSSFLFAVSRTRVMVVRLPSAAAIAARVKKLREAIAVRPTRLTLSNYLLQAKQLYRDLLGPATALLSQNRNWIIVPDGVLHYLPFEALLEPGEFNDTDPSKLPYLVRKYAISYVPSASVLAQLQRKRRPGRDRDSLVAFADPAYPGANDAGLSQRSATTSSAAQLARLPQTRREVQAIGELYGSKRLYFGEQASEEQVKSTGSLNADVIQYAVHGLLNEDRPQFSGLALSLKPGQSEDGLLQVYEILNLRIQADLVILSACETGLGRERQGEGLTGLTQAFLHAGAASVVVSLWKVEDSSTADLMIFFHRSLRSGAGKSEALRRARVDLIGSGGFSYPYYWAPFVLVGVPR